MADLVTGQLASSLASGISRNVSPERKAERAGAKLLKEQRQQELERVQATKATPEDLALQGDIQTQELKKLKDQNRQTLLGATRARTFDSFDRFGADKDTRHLTTLVQDLRSNGMPMGPLESVVRVDPVTEADRMALGKTGMPADAFLDGPLQDTMVKFTHTDGTTTLEPVMVLQALTGYQRYANKRSVAESTAQVELALLYKKLSAESKSSPGGVGVGLKTKDEREAHRTVIAQLDAEGVDVKTPEGIKAYAKTFNSVFNDIVERNARTSGQKEVTDVEQTKVALERKALDEFDKDFFELDFTDPKVRRAFEGDIEKIERLGKLKLSEGDKKKFGFIKQLIAIGDPAATITSAETGIIDQFSNNVRKFTTDKVKGIAASSAYAAYRNILRNALYGSVLTPGEMKAFRDQFGDLGQQAGPVLAQFKTALSQLKGEMEALRATNNSHVMAFRLGSDSTALDEILSSLDQRIQFFDAQTGGKSFLTPEEAGVPPNATGATGTTTLTPERRQQMEDLVSSLGGAQ